jgi:hypothetical protein
MQQRILAHFPAHTHPLTVVSDPDRLLGEEEVLAALVARGFTLVAEPDPVYLRRRLAEAEPWSAERPLVVVTAGPLNTLPYDLWQEGRRVELALHTFFPNLVYPLVRLLSPAQRWRLAQAPPPRRPLAREATSDFILRHAFGAEVAALAQPAQLIAWLDAYHAQPEPMPDALAQSLLAALRRSPIYEGWPLAELMGSREALTTFVREQWLGYLQRSTGQPFAEAGTAYVLAFERDEGLQDVLPRLLRSGALPRVPLRQPERLPSWARSAVLAEGEEDGARRASELLATLEQAQPLATADGRWEDWQMVARTWAALSSLRYDPRRGLGAEQEKQCRQLQGQLDAAFWAWLHRTYAALGSQRLPLPHHVSHVPHYMAYQQRRGAWQRAALIILDGMALHDWLLIGPAWQARHAGWRFHEQLVLAQMPSITAVSRQALVSGLRPADFAATLGSNRAEAAEWAAFWAGEDLPAECCPYGYLALDRVGLPAELSSARTRVACLVDSSVDEMVHGATLGEKGVQAALQVWLDGGSGGLESLIDELLRLGFAVHVASDHGHVQAEGMGRPSEGVMVQTRGQRARIYTDAASARRVQQGYAETLLWHDDGLLPPGVHALMPQGRRAFATFGETVVSHGGPTVEEVIVPLISITQGPPDSDADGYGPGASHECA